MKLLQHTECYEMDAGSQPITLQQAQDPTASSSLANACADLRLELARKDAEIEALQGALAAAAACQEDPPHLALLRPEQSFADQVLAHGQHGCPDLDQHHSCKAVGGGDNHHAFSREKPFVGDDQPTGD